MFASFGLRGLFGAALLFSLAGCRYSRSPGFPDQNHHAERHPNQKSVESCLRRQATEAQDNEPRLAKPSHKQVGYELQRWLLEGLERFGQYGIVPREFPLWEFGTCKIQPYVIIAHSSPEDFKPYAKRVTLTSWGRKGRSTVYEIETKTGQGISYVIPAQPFLYEVAEALLALSATPCQTVLFLGDAISASKDTKCCDFIIPETAIYGCNANVYLSPDISFVQRNQRPSVRV